MAIPQQGEQRIPQRSWLASQAEILSSMLSKRRCRLNNVECDQKETQHKSLHTCAHATTFKCPYTHMHMLPHSNVLTYMCTYCHIQMCHCTHIYTCYHIQMFLYTCAHATTSKCAMLPYSSVLPCAHATIVHTHAYS